ncbi:MAG TPA: hypothetical protein VMU63_06570 [Acidimicrobiales bacterium]|nr:hypothetical protein [Acidimicrobiales bacterium]
MTTHIIETLVAYHTTEDEDDPVHHVGGWACPRGKRIIAEHLAFGTADRRVCDDCHGRPEISHAALGEIVSALADAVCQYLPLWSGTRA